MKDLKLSFFDKRNILGYSGPYIADTYIVEDVLHVVLNTGEDIEVGIITPLPARNATEVTVTSEGILQVTFDNGDVVELGYMADIITTTYPDFQNDGIYSPNTGDFKPLEIDVPGSKVVTNGTLVDLIAEEPHTSLNSSVGIDLNNIQEYVLTTTIRNYTVPLSRGFNLLEWDGVTDGVITLPIGLVRLTTSGLHVGSNGEVYLLLRDILTDEVIEYGPRTNSANTSDVCRLALDITLFNDVPRKVRVEQYAPNDASTGGYISTSYSPSTDLPVVIRKLTVTKLSDTDYILPTDELIRASEYAFKDYLDWTSNVPESKGTWDTNWLREVQGLKIDTRVIVGDWVYLMATTGRGGIAYNYVTGVSKYLKLSGHSTVVSNESKLICLNNYQAVTLEQGKVVERLRYSESVGSGFQVAGLAIDGNSVLGYLGDRGWVHIDLITGDIRKTNITNTVPTDTIMSILPMSLPLAIESTNIGWLLHYKTKAIVFNIDKQVLRTIDLPYATSGLTTSGEKLVTVQDIVQMGKVSPTYDENLITNEYTVTTNMSTNGNLILGRDAAVNGAGYEVKNPLGKNEYNPLIINFKLNRGPRPVSAINVWANRDGWSKIGRVVFFAKNELGDMVEVGGVRTTSATNLRAIPFVVGPVVSDEFEVHVYDLEYIKNTRVTYIREISLWENRSNNSSISVIPDLTVPREGYSITGPEGNIDITNITSYRNSRSAWSHTPETTVTDILIDVPNPMTPRTLILSRSTTNSPTDVFVYGELDGVWVHLHHTPRLHQSSIYDLRLTMDTRAYHTDGITFTKFKISFRSTAGNPIYLYYLGLGTWVRNIDNFVTTYTLPITEDLRYNGTMESPTIRYDLPVITDGTLTGDGYEISSEVAPGGRLSNIDRIFDGQNGTYSTVNTVATSELIIDFKGQVRTFNELTVRGHATIHVRRVRIFIDNGNDGWTYVTTATFSNGRYVSQLSQTISSSRIMLRMELGSSNNIGYIYDISLGLKEGDLDDRLSLPGDHVAVSSDQWSPAQLPVLGTPSTIDSQLIEVKPGKLLNNRGMLIDIATKEVLRTGGLNSDWSNSTESANLSKGGIVRSRMDTSGMLQIQTDELLQIPEIPTRNFGGSNDTFLDQPYSNSSRVAFNDVTRTSSGLQWLTSGAQGDTVYVYDEDTDDLSRIMGTNISWHSLLTDKSDRVILMDKYMSAIGVVSNSKLPYVRQKANITIDDVEMYSIENRVYGNNFTVSDESITTVLASFKYPLLDSIDVPYEMSQLDRPIKYKLEFNRLKKSEGFIYAQTNNGVTRAISIEVDIFKDGSWETVLSVVPASTKLIEQIFKFDAPVEFTKIRFTLTGNVRNRVGINKLSLLSSEEIDHTDIDYRVTMDIFRQNRDELSKHGWEKCTGWNSEVTGYHTEEYINSPRPGILSPVRSRSEAWCLSYSSLVSNTITLSYDDPVIVNELRIYQGHTGISTFTGRIEGSINGIEWVPISELKTIESLPYTESLKLTLNNTTAYLKYRVVIDPVGADLISIWKLLLKTTNDILTEGPKLISTWSYYVMNYKVATPDGGWYLVNTDRASDHIYRVTPEGIFKRIYIGDEIVDYTSPSEKINGAYWDHVQEELVLLFGHSKGVELRYKNNKWRHIDNSPKYINHLPVPLPNGKLLLSNKIGWSLNQKDQETNYSENIPVNSSTDGYGYESYGHTPSGTTFVLNSKTSNHAIVARNGIDLETQTYMTNKQYLKPIITKHGELLLWPHSGANTNQLRAVKITYDDVVPPPESVLNDYRMK